MSFAKRATFEETAGAEWRANEAIRGFVEAAEHRCSNCYHKAFGKSPIKCVNEPGGK